MKQKNLNELTLTQIIGKIPSSTSSRIIKFSFDPKHLIKDMRNGMSPYMFAKKNKVCMATVYHHIRRKRKRNPNYPFVKSLPNKK